MTALVALVFEERDRDKVGILINNSEKEGKPAWSSGLDGTH